MPVDNLHKLLSTLFNKGVLHADHNFIYDFSDKPFETSPCNLFVNAYVKLVYDCVSKLFGGETLRASIKFNTGLQDDLIHFVAVLIEDNFEALKLNYVILGLHDDI